MQSLVSETTQKRFADFEAWMTASGATGKEAGRWLVLTHDNPDPDALAAAALLAQLLKRRFRCIVTVAHGGLIGRAENREMVRSLGLRLSHVRYLQWKNYRRIALVDAQPRTGNHQLPDDVVADAVFDHHPLRKATQACPFHDVRTEYGATATMLAEYLLAAGLEPPRRLVTALVYAVRSETLDFSRESAGPDRALFDHFFAAADKRTLGRIQNPRLPKSYFQTLHRGLETTQSVGPLIVSHLGTVAQPDIVPEIADLLLRLEGKTWSFCSGRFEERLYCSIRTTNPRADASRLMRRLLGRRGKGGGHGMIAGGWIPLPEPDDDGAAIATYLARRLAKLLRKNPDRLLPLDLAEAAVKAEAAEAEEKSVGDS